MKFAELVKRNPFCSPFINADCSSNNVESGPGRSSPKMGKTSLIPSRNIAAAAASSGLTRSIVRILGICMLLSFCLCLLNNWSLVSSGIFATFFDTGGGGIVGQVEYGSLKYYILCALGGAASCGLTHFAITPLDLVKCRIQVDPAKYKSLGTGLGVTIKEEGFKAITLGWSPTLIGYSLQGMFKFGFYEMFKIVYSSLIGEENAFLFRTSLYLAASASAEFFADIALSPFEAMKVRMQTQSGWAKTMRQAFPRLMQEEGVGGFYKSLVPLWGRQIPYTMMKFASFERTVEMMYKYVLGKAQNQTTKPEQLMVTFASGYIAGVFCAVVSHPADTLVSQMNKDKGSSVGDIVKRLGFKGLWGGLGARIIMVGTLTALQWFIYDGVKVALGIPRPPPPQPPASLRGKV